MQIQCLHWNNLLNLSNLTLTAKNENKKRKNPETDCIYNLVFKIFAELREKCWEIKMQMYFLDVLLTLL